MAKTCPATNNTSLSCRHPNPTTKGTGIGPAGKGPVSPRSPRTIARQGPPSRETSQASITSRTTRSMTRQIRKNASLPPATRKRLVTGHPRYSRQKIVETVIARSAVRLEGFEPPTPGLGMRQRLLFRTDLLGNLACLYDFRRFPVALILFRSAPFWPGCSTVAVHQLPCTGEVR